MKVPYQYRFLIILGKALHIYGVPSYRIQRYLSEVAALKGVKCSFMDTPTWINYVFYEDDENTYNYSDNVPIGGINLGGLSEVVRTTKMLIADEISFKEAQEQINETAKHSNGYNNFIELLSYILSAGSFSIILQTSWASTLIASLLGAMVYGLVLLSYKSSYVRSTLESLASFLSTIITGVLSLYIDNINISLTILASIIVFIPGLALTTALEEITSRSLLSGTAKLFDALISLFKQFFGVAMGLSLLPMFIDIKPSLVINDIPPLAIYPATIFLALSLSAVFMVSKKDILWATITGFIAFSATVLFDFTGLLVSIFIGTIITTETSKLFTRLTSSPRLVFQIPGLIMLVPGSKAFISLSTLFGEADIDVDHTMGLQVIYILMGIIGGLIFSGSFSESRLANYKDFKLPKP